MNDTSGWIKLHRSILDWEWWDDRNTRDLFIYCLIKANHDETKWHGDFIPRGSFVTSLPLLAQGAGLSIQQTRTSLSKLKSTNDLTDTTTDNHRIVTICNYDRYQCLDEDKQQEGQQANNSEVTGEQQANNSKQELKNGRNNKEKKDTKVSLKKKNSFVDILCQNGVSEENATAWYEVRKSKRLLCGESQIRHILDVLSKVTSAKEISANDAVRIAVIRSWGGIEMRFFDNINLADYGIDTQQISLFDNPLVKPKTIWQ